MQSAVGVKDLVVQRGDVRAVNGLSFSIDQGEVLALLGPTALESPRRSKPWRATSLPTLAPSRSWALIQEEIMPAWFATLGSCCSAAVSTPHLVQPRH